MFFGDRFDAGHRLAHQLKNYKGNKDAIILAIPRGALQIGYVLAKELHLPLDVALIKKIGAPDNPEFAIGAASMDNYFIDPEFSIMYKSHIEDEVRKIQHLLKKRYHEYNENKKPLDLKDKIIILVDDGIATGQTMLAAIELIKQKNPKEIIVAVPVASHEAIENISKKVDKIVCLIVPQLFFGVGQFYKNFEQVEDNDAIRLLKEANK